MSPVFQATTLPSPFKMEMEGGVKRDYEEAFEQPWYVLAAPRIELVDRTRAITREEERNALFPTAGPVSDEFWQGADVVLFHAPLEFPMEIKANIDIPETLNQLREWTGLHAGEVADVLGVSRRALYYWLSSGRPSPGKRHEVLRLASNLIPLGKRWNPERTRIWLTSGDPSPLDLLKQKHEEQFNYLRRLHEDEALIPTRRLTDAELVIDDEARVALTSEHAREVLQRFSSPRKLQSKRTWDPPELTDSAPTDE